jgi:hypothetical protein
MIIFVIRHKSSNGVQYCRWILRPCLSTLAPTTAKPNWGGAFHCNSLRVSEVTSHDNIPVRATRHAKYIKAHAQKAELGVVFVKIYLISSKLFL